jgi:Effector Associated Constant Component 1
MLGGSVFVEYSVSLVDQGRTDMLRGLGAMLLDHEDLHGRVEFVEAPPQAGAMGPIIAELHLLLADQDHLQTAGGVLVAWLLSKRRTIKIRLTRADTKAEFTVTSAGGDTEAAVRKMMEQLSQELAQNPESAALPADGES